MADNQFGDTDDLPWDTFRADDQRIVLKSPDRTATIVITRATFTTKGPGYLMDGWSSESPYNPDDAVHDDDEVTTDWDTVVDTVSEWADKYEEL